MSFKPSRRRALPRARRAPRLASFKPASPRTRLAWLASAGLLLMAIGQQSANAGGHEAPKFKRIPIQFIAALAKPEATSGTGAQNWGLWPVDPGPRGVRLNRYDKLVANGGVAPAKWQFDATDWWLEENGLIMEPPEFPMAPGQYMVTGDRKVTTVLTIYPPDEAGDSRWELADGATLYDVTHLGCRSARYTAGEGQTACTPANASPADFRVKAGAEMPPVPGCNKQDYAVLFVIGVPQ